MGSPSCPRRPPPADTGRRVSTQPNTVKHAPTQAHLVARVQAPALIVQAMGSTGDLTEVVSTRHPCLNINLSHHGKPRRSQRGRWIEGRRTFVPFYAQPSPTPLLASPAPGSEGPDLPSATLETLPAPATVMYGSDASRRTQHRCGHDHHRCDHDQWHAHRTSPHSAPPLRARTVPPC